MISPATPGLAERIDAITRFLPALGGPHGKCQFVGAHFEGGVEFGHNIRGTLA